jgi:hypothetical protein
VNETEKCPFCGDDASEVYTSGLHVPNGFACTVRQRDVEKAGREKAEARAIAAEENASRLQESAKRDFFRAEKADAHVKNQRTELRQLHRQISLLRTRCGAFGDPGGCPNPDLFARCLWKKECGSIIAMLAALEVSESRTEKAGVAIGEEQK